MSSFPSVRRYQTSSTSVLAQRSPREERIAKLVACINEAFIQKEGNEGSGSLDMDLSDDDSSSESEDESFGLEWGVEEEAVLKAIEEKYAEEKRLRLDEVRVQRISRQDWKIGDHTEEEAEPLVINSSVAGSVKREPLGEDNTTNVMKQRSPGESRIYAGRTAGLGFSLAAGTQREREMEIETRIQAAKEQQERVRQAWMKKEVENQFQRIREQTREREERVERRREVIPQPVQQEGREEFSRYPLTKKQRKRKQDLARWERKRAKREEISRLRNCERELWQLRASQVQGMPGQGTSPFALRQAAKLSGIANRIGVLRRAKQEQERQQDEEAQQIPQPDLDRLVASSSTLVKEEPQSPRNSQLFHQENEEQD